MPENKYIRLLGGNSDEINSFCQNHENIYRYLPLERFLDVIHSMNLYFVSPEKWKDPFDNFLFKREIRNTNSFLKKLFVGCFTLNPHSQAYWSIYAPEGYSVRLKFNTRELFDLILKLKDRTWFGELNYKKEKEIIEILQNTTGLRDALESNTINDIFLQVFTYKRMPFEFEKEVRIIIESKPTQDKVKRVRFTDFDLIRGVFLDPRMKPNEEIALKFYLKERFGIRAKKSRLFEDKNLTIQ